MSRRKRLLARSKAARAPHVPMAFALSVTENGELRCQLASGYVITMERDHWVDLLNYGSEIRLFIALNHILLPRDVEPSWKRNLHRFLQEREPFPEKRVARPRVVRPRKEKKLPIHAADWIADL